ncbi:hypothetical protein IFM89_005902 [Coptis chinensis]|uniref:Uncharacterized protein n=1 Tax=Coptis chinensis TaxID=261450 RepID=A0A835HR93_9MAGN|nr:hypothetical protein IFM89_005902 [Coptis chinensis]
MSLKQYRSGGSFDLPQELLRFDIFKPLHDTWKLYVLKILKSPRNTQQIARCLLHTDLHGGIVVFAKVAGVMKAAGSVKVGTAAAAMTAAAVSGSKPEQNEAPKKPSQ